MTNSEKVVLPKEVYEALENCKRSWRRITDEDGINLMFVTVIGVASGESHDLATIKRFALDEPTKYIQALANGYAVEKDELAKEVEQKITSWLNKPYLQEPIIEVPEFAEQLTSFMRYKLENQS